MSFPSMNPSCFRLIRCWSMAYCSTSSWKRSSGTGNVWLCLASSQDLKFGRPGACSGQSTLLIRMLLNFVLVLPRTSSLSQNSHRFCWFSGRAGLKYLSYYKNPLSCTSHTVVEACTNLGTTPKLNCVPILPFYHKSYLDQSLNFLRPFDYFSIS